MNTSNPLDRLKSLPASVSFSEEHDSLLDELLDLPSPPQQIRTQRSAFLDRVAGALHDDAHHIGDNQYAVPHATTPNYSCLFAAILLAEASYAAGEPNLACINYQAAIRRSAHFYAMYTQTQQGVCALPQFEEAISIVQRDPSEQLALFAANGPPAGVEVCEHWDHAESHWALGAKLYTWLDRITSDPRICLIVLICGRAAHCLTVRPAHGSAHRTIYLLDTHGDWQSQRHSRQNYYTWGTSAEPLACYLTNAARVPSDSLMFEARIFFVPRAPSSMLLD